MFVCLFAAVVKVAGENGSRTCFGERTFGRGAGWSSTRHKISCEEDWGYTRQDVVRGTRHGLEVKPKAKKYDVPTEVQCCAINSVVGRSRGGAE